MLEVELNVVSGKQAGTRISLPEGKFMVGRAKECRLRPKSELVSLHHCVFILDGYALRIRDLGSILGTKVNGEAIHGDIVLQPGDIVSVGKLDLEVVQRNSPSDKTPVSSPPEAPTNDPATAQPTDIDTLITDLVWHRPRLATEQETQILYREMDTTLRFVGNRLSVLNQILLDGQLDLTPERLEALLDLVLLCKYDRLDIESPDYHNICVALADLPNWLEHRAPHLVSKCRRALEHVLRSHTGLTVRSLFASSLKCQVCGDQHSATLWPLNGDKLPFYFQEERGTFDVPVRCTARDVTWYVAWDEFPGPIIDIERMRTYSLTCVVCERAGCESCDGRGYVELPMWVKYDITEAFLGNKFKCRGCGKSAYGFIPDTGRFIKDLARMEISSCPSCGCFQ